MSESRGQQCQGACPGEIGTSEGPESGGATDARRLIGARSAKDSDESSQPPGPPGPAGPGSMIVWGIQMNFFAHIFFMGITPGTHHRKIMHEP